MGRGESDADRYMAALVDSHRSEVAVLGPDQAHANLEAACIRKFGQIVGALLADHVHQKVTEKAVS